MDVTYGLLNSLVKTKSIERILAPIASQVKEITLDLDEYVAGPFSVEETGRER